MIGARRAGFDRAIVRIGALARFIIFLRMCVCRGITGSCKVFMGAVYGLIEVGAWTIDVDFFFLSFIYICGKSQARDRVVGRETMRF